MLHTEMLAEANLTVDQAILAVIVVWALMDRFQLYFRKVKDK